jgi:flagellar M-ring protein FliF
MPPQLQALLQNRNALIGIGLALLGLILLLVFQPWGGGGEKSTSEPLTEEQRGLATVETLGKAIEIQALLAREGLRMERAEADGGKSIIRFGDKATQEDRDRALITLVESGLMDRNVGLEAFDKGDLTASREEKRIKLIRAQQGELARLIRKIRPIQDATVSLSIPEPSIFKSEQKPMSASVQVTLDSGDRLTRDKVRSIINLVVASIQGLDAQHVALSDTNGNTYNSVLDVGSELNDRLEEQDQYMKQKVASQLDKLVGTGNYVVTVSTLLREAPREEMTQTFDPSQSSVSSKQQFTEKLNTAGGSQLAGGPTSTVLPEGLQGAAGASNPKLDKGYQRNGTEVSYATGKTQVVETFMPGMIEDITIAVSVDAAHFPAMNLDELRLLLARAASPKVDPVNVSVVKTTFERPATHMALDKSLAPTPESSELPGWVFWAAGTLLAVLVAGVMMSLFKSGGATAAEREALAMTQQEVQALKEMSLQQQAQLQTSQQQTMRLLEERAATPSPEMQQLLATLAEMRQQMAATPPDETLEVKVKSWIEGA